MRAMMWFRADLRVMDNPALHAAARDADRGVVAVFVICPEQWNAHDMAPIKVEFIRRHLAALSSTLQVRNIALQIVETATFEGVPRVLCALAREHQCDALFYNREYEVNERHRDEAVTRAFESAGSMVHSFTDQCVFEPGEIRTGEGRYYSVFTPFNRAWLRAVEEDPGRIDPLGVPRKQQEMVGEPDGVPDQILGFEDLSVFPDPWPTGERAASKLLSRFVRERIGDYIIDRDVPSVEGTSMLSAYLVSGVVSLRQCVRAAYDARAEHNAAGASGVDRWKSELVWREFYKHILFGYPRVSMHHAFQRVTDRIVWDVDDGLFRAWCEGRTGYPIVDAAMRQLTQTGWMHNRLRMIVAMFLSKNLFLDWRLGERFFMRHLIDGDLSANNGGWQWAASTGTDAAPYFRVFNPCSQAKKCDPDGVFIRRYLPGLVDLEPSALHDPSKIPLLLRGVNGYPEPIVNHSKTRIRAIEAFKALKG